MTAAESFLLTALLAAVWQVALIAVVGAGCAAVAARAGGAARHRVWLLVLLAASLLPWWSAASILRPADRPLVDGVTTGTAARRGADVAPAVAGGPAAASTRERIGVTAGLARALAGLYLAGLALRAVGLLVSGRRALALRDRGRAATLSSRAARIVEECRRALGLPSVPIVVSSRLVSPATVGAWPAAILVPPGLDAMPPELVKAALAHEMAHVRRRDFALHLVCEVAALPLYWHPAMAVIRRELRRGREEACDALVANHLMEPRSYARALVELARRLEAAGREPALGLFGGVSLEDRVMKLLHTVPTRSALRHAAVGSAAVLIGFVSAIASTGSVSVVEAATARAAVRADAEPGATGAVAGRGDDGERVDGYTYSAGGSRDPFRDLRVQEPRLVDVHDPRGFLVQEVALKGIVKGARGWTAMVAGPDRRTYFVSAGQVFLDGTLLSVDAGGLTFQQQVRDPLAPPRSRELRVSLHPEVR